MKLDRLHRVCVLVSALGAALAYGLASGSAVTPIIAIPAGLLAWWLGGTRLRAIIPRLVINVVVVGAVVYTMWVAITRVVEIRLIANLLLALLIAKMYDRVTKRDDAQVLVLAVFLAIAAVLEDVRLSIGLVLAVVCPFLAAGVMLQQIVSGAEMSEKSRASPWGGAPVLAPALSVGRRVGPHFRRLLGVSLTVIAVLSYGVFIAVPRGLGNGLYGNIGQRSSSRTTGFASEVSLGSPGLITESQRVVMHVAMETEDGDSLGNPDKVYYLRGSVLSEYDERGRWVVAGANRRGDRRPRGSPIQLFSGVFHPIDKDRVGAIIRQRYSLVDYSGDDRYLFSVLFPVTIQASRTASVRIDPGTHTLLARELSRRFEYVIESVEAPRAEAVESALDPEGGAPPGDGGDPPEPRRELSNQSSRQGDRPPEVSSVIGDLARSVLLERGVEIPEVWEPEDVVSVTTELRNWLRGSFEYTLELEAAPTGRDPTEWFLTQHRRGHCEYFASALARMCQSLGINARLVTGYVAAEWNPATGMYVVRASNAHAWVEVDHGSGNWRTYDATPPADFSRLHHSSDGVFTYILHVFDAIDQWWASNVVTYEGRGIDVTRVRDQGASALDSMLGENPLSDLESELRSGSIDLYLMIAAGAAGVFMVAYAVYRGIRAVARRLRVRREHAGATARVPAPILQSAEDLHDALLRALARLRSPKPPWAPPLAHISGLALDAETTATLREAADAYYKVVFAGMLVPRDTLNALRRRVSGIRKRGSP